MKQNTQPVPTSMKRKIKFATIILRKKKFGKRKLAVVSHSFLNGILQPETRNPKQLLKLK